jgi:hypothetical protein
LGSDNSSSLCKAVIVHGKVKRRTSDLPMSKRDAIYT